MGCRGYYHSKYLAELCVTGISNTRQLTDGICSSTCAVFMEMMHHNAGVRTVVAGGRPTYGPMQSPGQSRGARMYGVDVLDWDIAFAQSINHNALPPALPNRTINQDVYITFASVNLRDQIRQNETTPLQFLYEAADCRIFYTPNTWYNYSALWQYAADAIWTNPSLCVQDSTGYASTANSTTEPKTAPTAAAKVNVPSNLTGIITLSGDPGEFPANLGGEIVDGGVTALQPIGDPCGKGYPRCAGHLSCQPVKVCEKGALTDTHLCLNTCNSFLTKCSQGSGTTSALKCQYNTHHPEKDGHAAFWSGACAPLLPKTCSLSTSYQFDVDDEFDDSEK
jgi:hypothetical protein